MTMSIRILRLLLSTLAAIAAVTFGATANAKFYGGGFDPVEFNGYAVFSLNSACETDGLHFQGIGGCVFNLAALYVTLDNGTVTSDLVVQSNPPAGLGNPNSKLPDYLDMWSLYYQGGNLAWVNTGFIGGFAATDTADFPGKWWVQFVAAPSAGQSIVDFDNNVFLYNNATPGSSYIAWCSQAWIATPGSHTLQWVRLGVLFGAMMGMISSLLVFQYGQARIWFDMSRDRLLPALFSRVHPKYDTPHVSTWIAGVVVGIPAGILDIGTLGDLTNIGTLFAFVVVSGGVIILRRTQPDYPRGFRVPWVPFLPLLSMGCCLVLMLSLPLETWIRFIVWLIIGLGIYFLYSRKQVAAL
jgi:hypothetical protein